MIPVTNLRAGAVFKEGGEPFLVLKYTHTKVGRGNAVIKLKVKSLKSKRTLEKTYVSGAVAKEADVEKVKAQFLYSDGERVYFMESDTFEQTGVAARQLEEEAPFLKEGQEVYLLKFEDQPLGVELPANVVLEVVDTEPGFKGNSATNVLKPAEVETGLTVSVPLFIKVGDKVKVDTRTGEYLERM